MKSLDYTYPEKKKHLKIIGALVLFNIIVFSIFVSPTFYRDYDEFTSNARIYTILSTIVSFVIGMPLISLVVGLSVALLPFRGLPFGIKYLRASLLTLLAFNVFFFLGHVYIITMFLTGWNPKQWQVDNPNYQMLRAREIEKYKLEIKDFCDSSNFYFDWAHRELDREGNQSEIAEYLSLKINNIEDTLAKRTIEFKKTARELGLTETEYKKVFDDLSEYYEVTVNKNKRLKERGIVIELE